MTGAAVAVGDANGLAANCSRSSEARCVVVAALAGAALPSTSLPNKSRIGCDDGCDVAVAAISHDVRQSKLLKVFGQALPGTEGAVATVGELRNGFVFFLY